ncbi:site-specific DNA-methyltransferase [Chryseobacterium sp. SNU WT5]|uniref:DNA methyltransferase n=1 Tax=Chryseobacterium sp. SNU WT5 TaxID=2594269 RepID=UPI00117F782B|nr:DNA methyltransferase [Chryseobacterium sp. SNU WT5]QDP86059.1 site-specific DNA-methyltransferase [Chryseobacterium sp. SNU WT5]
MLERIQLHHADNLEIMKTLSDESVDVICIDLPYLYLKNQKLERVFDELKFFSECKRLLTKDGFIIMFGRGTSFYRWNTILEYLGYTFKEEIIWNKSYGSSPLMAITRIHETISIFSKGNGSISKVKVPYLEMRSFDIGAIKTDVSRINSSFGNKKHFEALLKYFNDGEISFDGDYDSSTTITSGRKRVNRCISTAQAIIDGMNEKSIIKLKREHYTSIHPTQKPVRLLERLLNLVLPKDKKEIVIADFFAGSMSCMEAVINLQNQNPDKTFHGIATEIDEEYFLAGKERIENKIKTEINLFNQTVI